MMHGLIQAFAALFSAAATVAACGAAGSLLIRWCGAKLSRMERAPLAFLSGAACLHLAIFAILAARIAYKPVWLILIAGTIAAALWRKAASDPSRPIERHWTAYLFGAIFAVYAIFYFVNAWVPEASADGAGYHLEIVARYLRAHGFERIPDNMYAGLGQGIELLFAPAFAFGRHSAAALVHFAFLIALGWAIFAFGARIGKPWCGAAAALLVFLSPVVGRDATSAYVDVGTAAIVFAVFYWLEIWDAQRDARLLLPAGLLAGYAYAAKYTAAIILVYALAFVAWRARRIRPLIVVTAAAALMAIPWVLKDWIYYQNPVMPFADEVFPNAYVHPIVEEQWVESLRHYELPSFRQLPWQVTVRGDYTEGILGPIFLLTPLALLAWRRPVGRRLLLAGFTLLAVYFGNIGTRFLIPCLPFFSLALALAIENRALLAILAAAHAVLSWPAMIPRYGNPYVWRVEKFPIAAALRLEPEDVYLRRNIGDYDRIVMINQNTPPGEPVLATGDLSSTSYVSHPVIDHFRSAEGNTDWDIINTGWAAVSQPTRQYVFRFPAQPVTRIRLLLTAGSSSIGKDQQWSVHELRFFDHGAELARDRGWRLRAWPNPFEVQLAFDNSPATRWRTWQAAAPGMYVEVDFGRPESIDEVRMEGADDDHWDGIGMAVARWDQGRWSTLADRFEEQRLAQIRWIRRAATFELRRRGIHYVIVGDRDFGANDYYADPAEWGLEVVARVPGATLLRIVP